MNALLITHLTEDLSHIKKNLVFWKDAMHIVYWAPVEWLETGSIFCFYISAASFSVSFRNRNEITSACDVLNVLKITNHK
jgi:hypothetical protein